MQGERSIVFLIGGVGFGNARRMLPLIQEAQSRGHKVLVYAAPQASQLLEPHLSRLGLEVSPLQGLSYPQQRKLNFLRLSLSLPKLALRYFANFLQLLRSLRKQSVDCVVVDSEYAGLLAATCLRIPIVVLNHAYLVKREWRRSSAQARRGLEFSYFFLECFEDALYRLVARWILVPWPFEKLVLPPPYRHLAWSNPDSPSENDLRFGEDDLLFLCGGSGIGDFSVITELAQSPLISCVWVAGIASPELLQHPKVRALGVVNDVSTLLQGFRYVSTQGGFSSLHDCVRMGRPVLIFPIGGHAEQSMNGQLMERLGLGVVCRSKETAQVQLKTYMSQYPNLQENIRNLAQPSLHFSIFENWDYLLSAVSRYEGPSSEVTRVPHTSDLS